MLSNREKENFYQLLRDGYMPHISNWVAKVSAIHHDEIHQLFNLDEIRKCGIIVARSGKVDIFNYLIICFPSLEISYYRHLYLRTAFFSKSLPMVDYLINVGKLTEISTENLLIVNSLLLSGDEKMVTHMLKKFPSIQTISLKYLSPMPFLYCNTSFLSYLFDLFPLADIVSSNSLPNNPAANVIAQLTIASGKLDKLKLIEEKMPLLIPSLTSAIIFSCAIGQHTTSSEIIPTATGVKRTSNTFNFPNVPNSRRIAVIKYLCNKYPKIVRCITQDVIKLIIRSIGKRTAIFDALMEIDLFCEQISTNQSLVHECLVIAVGQGNSSIIEKILQKQSYYPLQLGSSTDNKRNLRLRFCHLIATLDLDPGHYKQVVYLKKGDENSEQDNQIAISLGNLFLMAISYHNKALIKYFKQNYYQPINDWLKTCDAELPFCSATAKIDLVATTDFFDYLESAFPDHRRKIRLMKNSNWITSVTKRSLDGVKECIRHAKGTAFAITYNQFVRYIQDFQPEIVFHFCRIIYQGKLIHTPEGYLYDADGAIAFPPLYSWTRLFTEAYAKKDYPLLMTLLNLIGKQAIFTEQQFLSIYLATQTSSGSLFHGNPKDLGKIRVPDEVVNYFFPGDKKCIFSHLSVCTPDRKYEMLAYFINTAFLEGNYSLFIRLVREYPGLNDKLLFRIYQNLVIFNQSTTLSGFLKHQHSQTLYLLILSCFSVLKQILCPKIRDVIYRYFLTKGVVILWLEDNQIIYNLPNFKGMHSNGKISCSVEITSKIEQQVIDGIKRGVSQM